MYFIGDVHRDYKTYGYLINKMNMIGDAVGMDCSLQVGDLGIFNTKDRDKFTDQWCSNTQHKFIRGNHDNPELCKSNIHNLADQGYFEKQDMFVFAGGSSIDKIRRTEYIDWWSDEELGYKETALGLDSYSENKPSIMITHECPTVIKSHVLEVCRQRRKLFPGKFDPSNTELALQEMWGIHKPEVWIFGHYHVRMDITLEGTRFVCLGPVHEQGRIKESFVELKGLEW